jgi:hypothetical protein
VLSFSLFNPFSFPLLPPFLASLSSLSPSFPFPPAIASLSRLAFFPLLTLPFIFTLPSSQHISCIYLFLSLFPPSFPPTLPSPHFSSSPFPLSPSFLLPLWLPAITLYSYNPLVLSSVPSIPFFSPLSSDSLFCHSSYMTSSSHTRTHTYIHTHTFTAFQFTSKTCLVLSSFLN